MSGEKLERRDTLEIQAGADVLLHPGGGGIAIWVRRDELMPRAAVRFKTENPDGEDITIEQTCCMIAALRAGLRSVEKAIAKQHGVPEKDYAAMVAHADRVLNYEARSEVRV